MPASNIVSAGQCWHWFERARVAAETRRVLRRSGRVVIAHFDWLPLAGNVVEATERLILLHNPRWAFGGGSGVHPQCLIDLASAGFTGLETFSFDQAVPQRSPTIRSSCRTRCTLRTAQPGSRRSRTPRSG
jgi:hypothetical protein